MLVTDEIRKLRAAISSKEAQKVPAMDAIQVALKELRRWEFRCNAFRVRQTAVPSNEGFCEARRMYRLASDQLGKAQADLESLERELEVLKQDLGKIF